MLNRILNSKTKTVAFAAFLLAASGLISRLFGLLRDRLLASRFGASQELDIYFSAFRIPDFVYGILIVGGISAAFLPVFSEYFGGGEQSGKNEEWPAMATKLANNVLNSFFVILILVCGILTIFAPLIIKFIIPGFSLENRDMTIQLTRIMFLSPIFFGLASILSGILQYFDKFLAYSLAPILYNLGIIFGIIFLVPIFGIYGLALGVIFGALLYLIIQIPAAWHSGFRYEAIFDFKDSGLKKILKLMAPRVLGTGAYQVNLTVITAIASTLSVGSIAIFNFSNNLQYVPVGLIGIPFAISSFSVLSRAWVAGRKDKFLKSFSSSFCQIIFFIVPISLLMYLLRAQIVRMVLGAGNFGWWETRLTAACLGVFCIGILASSLIPLLTRMFFSFQNTKTPVIISLISMGSNIFFAYLFTYLLGFQNIFRNFSAGLMKLQTSANGSAIIENIEVIGLPLALSASAIIQLVLLFIFLRLKMGSFGCKEMWQSARKILIASGIMFIFSYFARQGLAGFVDMQTFLGVFIQTALVCFVALISYFLCASIFKISEFKNLKSAVLKEFSATPYGPE
ncbi:MAG: murein biosynthesis integral membrane protein MurJ [Candidatus Nealsonbacteria bacterium RIFCSPLOWO2_02_FULL_38_63]|nr:MAG: Integral membrane protein MviN [Parcubacteria group bacterium GW2011_GWA2_38_27]OGZ22699.1 MAG: murein biosynthesis integral membrane protein MurJ [Candidatus Nealsonbacteria bacterium RIFCSPLOWO2_01_FULL_38_120]OGZ26252.1 MAG: murein biosynthesis integral membrane protein MurJ [Candidatus Nealsonbacteria bacterium RIFCSPLOWO2_02_FULL_38_63]